ncbi:TonB-dependent receptor [Iodidimonas sp. SYSU 1G8]|uniref:TonB-dependent receptor n=1 Tax=Iodidimonas sp. SYSU 1G8 TaxID=3133967 RepID=UPI0031FF0906
MEQPNIFRRLRRPAALLSVSAVALGASAGWAQEPPPAPPAYSGPRTQIETVITEAQKVESDVQSTPVALTTVSGAELERTFAQDFRDVAGTAPNVLLQPVGAFQNASAFFIRGAGSADIESAADPGIAVLVDGIYMARTSTALVDFLDVSAVEVLRGPQGTLFGRNAIGGAVLLRHNAPDVNEFGVSGSVLAGKRGRLDMKGTVNVPIVEGVAAFRLAVKSTNFDGFYYNTYDNEKIGGQERLTILPSFRFEGENLDVTLRGEYNRTRDDSFPNVPHNVCETDPALGTAGNDLVITTVTALAGPDVARQFCATEVGKDDFTINHDHFNGFGANFDVWGLTGEVNYNVPDMGTFTYLGNYRDVKEDVYNDFDTTPFDIFNTRRQQWHWQTSHEFRFASEFSDFVDLVLGGYYFKQHYMMEQDGYGIFNVGVPNSGRSNVGRSEQWHDQWSIFGQADWHITDSLTLVTGVRYDSERKDFYHCGVGAADPVTRLCPVNVPGITDATFDSKVDIGDGVGFADGTNKWSNISPKVSLNYQFTDDLFAFASWSRGFRSGGFNGRANFSSTAGPFNEEKADNYEVGVKMDLFDRRLRLNVAAFWTEFSDLQRTIIRPAASGSGGQETVTENAADARSRGIELEMTAIPVEGLTLNGSLGYLDADTLSWCADLNGPLVGTPAGKDNCGTAVNLGAAGVLQPFENAGLEVTQAPKWTTRFAISYEIPVGNAGFLTFAGDWQYRSSLALVAAGFPPGTMDGEVQFNGDRVVARRDAAHIFNANITWREVEDRYKVSFFVKNLTNELYVSTTTNVAGLFNFRQPNEPRHWGVEISFDL